MLNKKHFFLRFQVIFAYKNFFLKINFFAFNSFFFCFQKTFLFCNTYVRCNSLQNESLMVIWCCNRAVSFLETEVPDAEGCSSSCSFSVYGCALYFVCFIASFVFFPSFFFPVTVPPGSTSCLLSVDSGIQRWSWKTFSKEYGVLNIYYGVLNILTVLWHFLMMGNIYKDNWDKHFWVFLYSNDCDSGADDSVHLEKGCICFIVNILGGHQLTPLSSQQRGRETVY